MSSGQGCDELLTDAIRASEQRSNGAASTPEQERLALIREAVEHRSGSWRPGPEALESVGALKKLSRIREEVVWLDSYFRCMERQRKPWNLTPHTHWKEHSPKIIALVSELDDHVCALFALAHGDDGDEGKSEFLA